MGANRSELQRRYTFLCTHAAHCERRCRINSRAGAGDVTGRWCFRRVQRKTARITYENCSIGRILGWKIRCHLCAKQRADGKLPQHRTRNLRQADRQHLWKPALPNPFATVFEQNRTEAGKRGIQTRFHWCRRSLWRSVRPQPWKSLCGFGRIFSVQQNQFRW